ncbi:MULTISPECIES: tetratricopeptide repeat protein [Rhodomicrobium]|uniref:tetratricopeptide repeat protein n=1 Tax=Rhodomicrobium TaxID=1068 RepID=UPI000F736E55|nr:MULTISPECIES: tetratricopeptide repeat protein [Rhodomicrobium]
MSDDNIFREVEDDMRREQIARLWDKYGVYVLIGAGIIIVIVGGYNMFNWWAEKRAAENGAAYYQAGQLVNDKKYAEASEAFAKLGNSAGGGYQTLAGLERAAIFAQEGRKGEAVAAYEKVVRNGTDPVLRDYATLQAATLRIDDADPAEMSRRLAGLNTDTNPWRYSARELLGLSAFRAGNMAESEKLFGQILGDPSAPAEIRKRAELMLALLVKAPGKVTIVPQAKPGTQKDSQTQ